MVPPVETLNEAEVPADDVIRLPPVSRGWRVLLLLAVAGLFLTGTAVGEDTWWPFGPWRMFSTSTPPSSSVTSLRIEIQEGNDPGWQQTVAAHEAGKLPPALEQAYFGKRKVWELYDLHEDPSELRNVYGNPDLQKIVNEMLVYMQECMMRDHDFLPLPMPVNA